MRNTSLIVIILLILFITGKTANKYENKVMIQNFEVINDVSVVEDTIQDVSGKTALFIGDSHTANHRWGWQVILCDNTGIKMNNLSVGGKTTGWMLDVAKTSLNKNYDYCFIYGGANDMFSHSIKAKTALKNVQSIVDICNVNSVQAVVITGFNPHTCVVTPDNPGYPKRYADFQQMLLDSIKGAKVIDTRSAVIRKDCGDAICHMNHSGHKKMCETIISKLKFKIHN